MSTFRKNDILSFSFYRLIFKSVFTLFTVPLLSRGFSESKINDFSGGRFWLTIFTCLQCNHTPQSFSLIAALKLVYKPENCELKQKSYPQKLLFSHHTIVVYQFLHFSCYAAYKIPLSFPYRDMGMIRESYWNVIAKILGSLWEGY